MVDEVLRTVRGLGRASAEVPGDRQRREDRAGADRAVAASSTRGPLDHGKGCDTRGVQGRMTWTSTRPWWDCGVKG